jgi:hypothetical protein
MTANAPARARRRRTGGRSKPRRPKRRLRFGPLPQPGSGSTNFSRTKQPALKRLTRAEWVKLVMSTYAFHSIIGPELRAIDAMAHEGRRARPRVWTAWELESILIYGRLRNKTSVKDCLEALSGDQRSRRILGFTRERTERHFALRTIHTRLPSESTLSRYLRLRFREEDRARAYRRLERALRDELLGLDSVAEEALILHVDGTNIETHFTAPIWQTVDRDGAQERVLCNSDNVTAPDAGYVAKGNPKSGKGWHVVSLSTPQGTVLAWTIAARDVSEKDLAVRIIEEFGAHVLPRIGKPRRVRVLTADGGFSSPRLRAALQKLGVVANVHHSSHASSEESLQNAEKRRRARIPFDPRGSSKSLANWYANGHRELVCRCEEGSTERDIGFTESGRLYMRLVGRCSRCGSVTITAGQWRRSKLSGGMYVRCEKGEEPDWAMGNPLTFDDPLAAAYGRSRFSHNEGLYGTLTSIKLKGTRWFRRMRQAELDVSLVFSILHSFALEVHRVARRNARRAGTLAIAPP